jgi:GT2 family glycosyltransferase
MKEPLISIVLINYNGKHFLKKCLESVYAQSYKNIEVIFIDNFSSDGSCDFIRGRYDKIIEVCNSENLGYAAAANQGIKLARGEYVMIMNPDIVMENSYIGKCIKVMEQMSDVAAVCGKILKYDFEKNEKTDVIDTVGLLCFRNRRVVDKGQGLRDKGQFNVSGEVFGVSGACPVYRKKALEDVAVFGEIFDEDFFMYKEDVDLSWRLRLFGRACYYESSAIAYHGRGTGVLKRFTHMEVLKNRKKLSKFIKFYSYKNQRLMQIKNEFATGFIMNFFPILWKEILMKGYILFFEPSLFKASFMLLRQMPGAIKKRRYIMKNKKTDWKKMEKWLSSGR